MSATVDGGHFKGHSMTLLHKALDLFIEPVDVGKEPLGPAAGTSAITVALVPIGADRDCTSMQSGLATAFRKISRHADRRSERQSVSVHVKQLGEGGEPRLSEDVDVAVLITGPGSVPQISVLSRGTMAEQGTASLLVYKGDPGEYESEGWSGVADHFLPESSVAKKLDRRATLPWSNRARSMRRLAQRCIELGSR